MTVEELVRGALAEHAGDVEGLGNPSRASAARREAQTIRVRRGASAVAAVAVVATLAGVAGSDLLRADHAPGPAQESGRTIRVAEEFAGRSLITSAETHGGQALEMTVDATAGSQWLVACAGVGPEYVVHRTIDGASEDTAVCGQVDALGDTMSFRWTAAEPAGTGRVLRLWITRAARIVEPEEAILAAAAYALPAPVTTLAGSDIQEVEPLDGTDWTYLDGVESQRGDRRLTRKYDALGQDVLLEIATEASQQGMIEVVVDGVVSPSPSAYSLGSTDLGNRLTAGRSHMVTVRIVGDVPADARLAIVRRVAESPEG